MGTYVIQQLPGVVGGSLLVIVDRGAASRCSVLSTRSCRRGGTRRNRSFVLLATAAPGGGERGGAAIMARWPVVGGVLLAGGDLHSGDKGLPNFTLIILPIRNIYLL